MSVPSMNQIEAAIVTSYIYIPVSDVNRSGEWYAKHLGFQWNPEPGHNIELRTTTGVWMFMRTDYPLPVAADSARRPVFGLQVTDIHMLHRTLREQGLQVGAITEDEGGSIFVLTVPDGNLIEIWGGWPSAC
ncbi:VOC family protein [Paenibacillus sp. PR3]|uniref:VOC family protein n=1 Tax=Paenibacillus terricola TaxID=2763503 RepID=A0ABR8MZM8_9BACL|nr:VOC family protein [Paenibacillus terricola]MBD3920466.1 VOC family protein [Paenibacillus terricola]